MPRTNLKSLRDSVDARLGAVAADLEAQQRTAAGLEDTIALSATLAAVLGCQLAVRRAKSMVAVDKHLASLHATLERMAAIMPTHFGASIDVINRAMKITTH